MPAIRTGNVNRANTLLRLAKQLFEWAAEDPVLAAVIVSVGTLEIYLFSQGTNVIEATLPVVGGLIFWYWWNNR